MSDDTLAKIAKLLRLAEKTENEFEAAAFMDKAQQLATLNSVDLAMARAHTAKAERRTKPTQRTIIMGERGKRYLKTYVKLAMAIGKANDLSFDIARTSTFVIAYGFDTDIDATEALFASLLVQMVAASDRYLKSGAYKTETVDHWDTREYEWTTKPISGITARNNFQEAFADRIRVRLNEARRAATEQAIADAAATTETVTDETGISGATGVELVLRAKEVEIADYKRATSTARGSWGGFRQSGAQSNHARHAGDAAGRTARIGSERAIGGSRAGISR